MTKTKTTAGEWRSRIVGHGSEAPDQLVANPRNYRTHPKAQQDALEGVLNEVGWVQDVIVNQRTGHVVDGHARIAIAITRQEPTVPVVYVDLDENEEGVILASLDPLAGMAGIDQEKLDQLLAEISVNDAALRAMLDTQRSQQANEGLTDPDDIPPLPEEPTTRIGDLWLLGDHKILCGDSTKHEDVARLMDGAQAAMMWTDPPYGVSYVGGTGLTIANDGAEGLPALLRGVWAAVSPVLAEGAPFYIAHPAGPLSVVFANTLVEAGWRIHETLVWVKDAMVLGHSDYHYRHEPVFYGWLPGPGRSGRGNHDGSRWFGGNAETSVFEIPRPKASPDHPTSKPVALVERHIANSSQANEIILEPFSGSGTTLIAAERLGRRAYCLELEPRYVDCAVRRWELFTGKEAKRG